MEFNGLDCLSGSSIRSRGILNKYKKRKTYRIPKNPNNKQLIKYKMVNRILL